MNKTTNTNNNLRCIVYGWLDEGRSVRVETVDLTAALDHAAQFNKSTLDIRWTLPPGTFGVLSTGRRFENGVPNKRETFDEIQKEIDSY